MQDTSLRFKMRSENYLGGKEDLISWPPGYFSRGAAEPLALSISCVCLGTVIVVLFSLWLLIPVLAEVICSA